MAGSHFGRDGTIKDCDADTPEECPLGGLHGDNPQDLVRKYEETMRDQVFATAIRQKPKSVARANRERLGWGQREAQKFEPYLQRGVARGRLLQRELEDATASGKKLSEKSIKRRMDFVNKQTKILAEAGLETQGLYSHMTAHGRIWEPGRVEAHEEIVNEILEGYKDVPSEGKAVVAGGVGGSGKGYVLSSSGLAPKGEYATVNPDDIKEIMAEKGLIPEVHGFSPMESSTLVHEEASHISKILAGRLMREKKNIVLDITMASEGSTARKVTDLTRAGYSVQPVFVDVPLETSVNRAQSRYEEGMSEYVRKMGKTVGGRPLDARHILGQKSRGGRANSVNAEALVKLASEGAFGKNVPYVFNNATGGEPRQMDYDSFARHVTGA